MPHQQPYYDSASDDDTPASRPSSILKPSSSSTTSMSSPPSSPKSVHFARADADHNWDPLFSNGKPTDLFNQFMRGVAKILINREAGIGVTPKLLLYFYTTYGTRTATDELYKSLFLHSSANYTRIAQLFTALSCEFCLVPGRDPLRPNVPALSPAGFATWMCTTTLAHPSAEAARLAAVLLTYRVAIDGPDSHSLHLPLPPPRVLPRTLPPHLFPPAADAVVLRALKDAIDAAFPRLRRAGVPACVSSSAPYDRPCDRGRDQEREYDQGRGHRRECNWRYAVADADADNMARHQRRERHRDEPGRGEQTQRYSTMEYPPPPKRSSRRL